MLAPAVPPPLMPSRPAALSLARSHVLCTQAFGVAVSGSYAYVAALNSDSLVVVDISNPASPVIRGSVVSSSLLDEVTAHRGWPRAPRHASAPPITLSLARSHVLWLQALGVAVSGSYAYVAAASSKSLVVIDVSNPASPVIRGSVVSSSLLHGVRATQFCDRGRPQAPLRASAPPIVFAPAAPPPADALSRSHSLSLARCHVLCAQAYGVAVSGSYAYVAAHHSYSLVVIDVSNPASPVIRGSVVSSSLLHGVRATQFCDRGRPQAPLRASAPPIVLAPAAAPPPADALSCFHARAVTCCVHRQLSSP
jgi:hypothetical protein